MFAVVLSDGGLERAGSSRSGGRKRKPDRETTQFFDLPLVKIRKMPYLVAVVRIEGAPGEARLRDKAKRRGKNSYLEIAVTH